MSVDRISLGGFRGIEGIKPQESTSPSQGPASSKSFGDMLSNAIKEVDQLQKTANDQIEGVVNGAPGATPHGAMLALEKADVAFQLMSTIRSKIVRAYEEVLRTQV